MGNAVDNFLDHCGLLTGLFVLVERAGLLHLTGTAVMRQETWLPDSYKSRIGRCWPRVSSHAGQRDLLPNLRTPSLDSPHAFLREMAMVSVPWREAGAAAILVVKLGSPTATCAFGTSCSRSSCLWGASQRPELKATHTRCIYPLVTLEGPGAARGRH